MNKKILFCCIFLFSLSFIFAQQYENIWLLGERNRNTKMDFNTNEPIFSATEGDIGGLEYSTVTISDSLGNLLFYCNGLRVFNKENEIMENGDSIVTDYWALTGDYDNRGYPLPQGAAIVKHHHTSSLYTIIHTATESFPNRARDKVLMTVVDMSQNNGLGKVIYKNKLIHQGEYEEFRLTKHANGRDWWIMVSDLGTTVTKQKYTSYLLANHDVSAPKVQLFQTSATIPWYGITFHNNARFSPDGKKFIDYNSYIDNFLIFDFDRCTGELYNMQEVILPHEGSSNNPAGQVIYGVAFSPNSRFLYAARNNYFYQYDLEASDVGASVYTAGHHFNNEGETVAYSSSHTGIDGRLYIEGGYWLDGPPGDGGPTWHRINFPNKKGMACALKLRKYYISKYEGTIGEPQYYPNYRLGPIDGTTCDSLGLDNHPLAHFRWDIEDTAAAYTVTFTDVSAYEPETWSWDFDGLGMSSDTNPVFTFPGPGIYEVCLTVCNVNSCDTICKTVVLGEIQQFQANFGFVITNSNEVTFQDQSQTNPISWSWNFGDGATSAEQHPTHIYAQAGTYTACLVACNALGICDTYCLDVVVETVGLDENTSKIEENLYTIFPNPVQQEVYIYPKNKQNTSNVIFSLYDITGRAVFTEKLSKNQAFWKINLGSLVEGLYFYEIKNEGGEMLAVGKLVRE